MHKNENKNIKEVSLYVNLYQNIKIRFKAKGFSKVEK